MGVRAGGAGLSPHGQSRNPVPLCAQYSFSGEWIRPSEGTLVGALDMGGASTQITFVPGGPILDESTQATFLLYGFKHSVYTHSYLCFGRDQILNRLLAGLVQVGSPGEEACWVPCPRQVLTAASHPPCRAARATASATPATTVATRTHCPWPPCTSRRVSKLHIPPASPRT